MKIGRKMMITWRRDVDGWTWGGASPGKKNEGIGKKSERGFSSNLEREN